MKKLLVGLLVLGSVSSFSGTLKNSKNGDFVSFEIIESNSKKSLFIDGTAANREVRSILLEEVSSELSDEKTKIHKANDPVFMMTKAEWDNRQAGVMNIGVPFAFGFDLLVMPIMLSAKLIHKSVINKDVKNIQAAITEGNEVEVNPRRFERILNFLKL